MMKNKDKITNSNRGVYLSSLGITLLFGCIMYSQSVLAKSHPNYSAQRTLFLAAEQVLKKDKKKAYENYKARLTDYPLYPYLEYQEIRRRFNHVSPKKVEDYLQNNKQIPIADRLRITWLRHLAKKEQWKSYVRFYLPTSNITLQCHYLHALIQSGKKQKAYDQVIPIWLSGESRPDACDPVFNAWRGAGKLTASLLWQRVEMAMNKGHSKLARYLSKFMSKKEKRMVDLWRKIYRDPGIILSTRQLNADNKRTRMMLTYGVKRMARSQANKALKVWQQLKNTHQFNSTQENNILRYIGIRMAVQNDPEAEEYLASLPADAEDKSLREWRIRIALKKNNWESAIHWIDLLSKEERQSEKWRYWKARSFEMLDESDKANKIFSKLATGRSYYGFLSADKVGYTYQLSHTPLRVEKQALENFQERQGVQRAHEFFLMKRYVEARREWFRATQSLPIKQLEIAAKLAASWGWYDRAITTIAQARFWDDLITRFPLAYRKSLTEKAHLQDIETAWVYAVVRQESAFITDARSTAGALGLMQLMPRTAKQVARQQKQTLKNKYELFKADKNLLLGTAYLRSVLNKLDNNPVLATAAYNAGPHRVKQWLPKNTAMPADIWIELVPFSETREYLRRVLAYTVIYEQRLGLSPTPLKERMRPVRMLGSILTDAKTVTKT